MSETIEQIVNALSLGSIYALLALGVALVFSIVRLVNFAHGEFLTIAGFTMYLGADAGLPFALLVVLAIAAAALTAIMLERVAFRPLRGAREDTLLIASFAVSVFLVSVLRIAFGSRPKVIPYPDWINSQINIGSLPLGWLDVITFGITIVALVAMSVFLKRTTTGIALRSAASDFDTTRLMGIKANRVIVGAFFVSGALAGLAAVLYFASSPFVDPTSGLQPVIKGFIATVIGGLGSLSGAVVGGFLLAGLEVAIRATLPDSLAVYSNAFVFVIVILVLLFRPSGLLGTPTTAGRV